MVTHRFVTIGHIHKSVGVHGEVLAELTGDLRPNEVIGIPVWIAPPPSGWRTGRITGAVEHGNTVRLAFEGLDTVEDAKPLAQRALVVEADDLDQGLRERIEQQQHHSRSSGLDREGYHVHDHLKGDLGTVSNTIETGANEVWVVSGVYGEVLIPVIDEVVEHIDEERCLIAVRLLPGLIEDE